MAEKKKYTDIDLSKYEGGFKPTEVLNQANALKTSAEAAVKNYGDFSYGRQGEYDNAMNAILNRKGFSYDLNGDALYQQYKDNYVTQGKQARMDAAGQAAAMTGGYGNSYAQTVGQQTYQGYLQGLNDKIPELYQLALDRYNSEGDRLATNYGLLSSDRSNALAEHEAGYNKLVADRDYYGNEYNSVYNREFTNWDSNRTYDTSQYWNEYNTGYQAEQDAIANERAAAQLAESIRANKASEDLAARQFAWQQNQSDVAKQYEGYINPDDVEVDEAGNIISVKGHTVAGADAGRTSAGTLATGATAEGFLARSGDNFKVTVDGKSYNVENKGKVDDEGTVNRLEKADAADGGVINLDGDLYVKKGNGYYKIGARNWFFNKGETQGYSNLLNALK